MKKLFFIFVLTVLLGTGCALTPPTIVNFSVNPSTINVGQTATLTWTVHNASLVKIDPFSGNQYPSGSTVVSPPATTTYVLIASNAGGSRTATVLLTVNTPVAPSPTEAVTTTPTIPVVNNFTVTPSSIINAGDSATLQWDTTDATSVFIEPDIGNVPLSGTQTVSPGNNTNYVLTASNAGNTISSAVTLNVNPYPPYSQSSSVPYPSAALGALPLINFFDINPPVIDAGSSTTIQWNVINADTIFIDHGIGNVMQSGSMTITPSTDTVYTLTAASLYGSATSSATVLVNPPPGVPAILSLSASPSSITSGGTSKLEWNIIGATSVSINQGIGSVPPSGTHDISPTVTTTYTVTATNTSGSVTASTTVTVATAAGGPPLIVSFTSNPSSIAPGKSSMLQWNVTGATSASIDQGIGAVAVSGTHLVSPAGTVAYTLTATNNSGSVSASTTVVVVPPTPVPVILRFSIYPTSIQPGGSAMLQWQTGGATLVSIDQGVGTVAAAGQLQVSPASTTKYTISATNAAGPATVSVTLTVIPVSGRPFIDAFSASPPVIPLGESTILQWQVTGASKVVISGIGTVPATGRRAVTPGETKVYILTASNDTGVTTHTAQVTVTFQRR